MDFFIILEEMNEFVVYILFSKSHTKTYVGYTSDLINRIRSHNYFAEKGYTIRYRPWVVIHLEVFEDKKAAMDKEKWFKTGVGREFIKNNILIESRI